MRIGTKDIIHDGFVALQKIAQNMQCYGVQKQRMRALVRRLPRFENTAVIAQIPTSNHVSESPYLYEIFPHRVSRYQQKMAVHTLAEMCTIQSSWKERNIRVVEWNRKDGYSLHERLLREHRIAPLLDSCLEETSVKRILTSKAVDREVVNG